MRFGILGPLRAHRPDGTAIPLGGPRLRALLAMLLLDAGRPIGIDRLIDGLYGDDPPAGAGNALQSQVSRLRQSLPVHLEPAGYRLAIAPGDVDAHRFATLAADGHRALASGDPDQAIALLGDALTLWRGQPLADVRDAPFAGPQIARLTELHLSTVENLCEAELRQVLAPASAVPPRHGLPTPGPSAGPPSPGAGTSGPPPPDLINRLRDLIASHPLRERPRALLMRALAASGRLGEALAAYEDTRRALAEELGADPSPELTALRTTLLRQSAPGGTPASDHPPARSRSADRLSAAARAPMRHGIPNQLTSFVGRDGELARVAESLRTRRLVTLHGPGGAGKTRLATEIAARHPADVYFVELAGAGPDDVPRTVMVALGLRDVSLNVPAGPHPATIASGPPGLRDASLDVPAGPHPATVASGPPDASLNVPAGPHPVTIASGPGVLDRLIGAIGDRRLLIVLDNCEHLVDAAAELTARLLAGAPGLRILATSREPLGITGETLCPVGGLPVPPGTGRPGPHDAGPDDGDPGGYAAVRLFADRAADVVPGFTVTADNAAAVRMLCRTLDGLPLAVELAAARLHALGIDEITARLDDRFRLLSGGSRTGAARHRTLHAVVAWSWDLLTEAEQVLARRFTVFAGGATLDAVEQVCGSGAGGGPEVVDLLTGLVAKSLVERDGGRYRMLATIRAYGAQRLDESGERDLMYRAHADHYLRFAARADPYLRCVDQILWLDRLDADRDNLHTALRRSTVLAPATALRLVSALSFYWWLRGLRTEAATLAGLALRAAGPEPPPGHTEEYVLGAFNAALSPGAGPGPDTAQAAARWTDYMRTMTSAPAQPFLLYLSAMAVGPPDSDPADIDLTRILELNHKLRGQIDDDPWSRALGAIGGGYILLFSGADAGLAEAEFRTSLAGFRALGDRWGTMIALSGLAELASWRGDPAATIEPVEEALRLAGELGSAVDVADLLRGRGQARMDTGDADAAAADFTRAAELAREAGAPEIVAAALLGLASLALARATRDRPHLPSPARAAWEMRPVTGHARTETPTPLPPTHRPGACSPADGHERSRPAHDAETGPETTGTDHEPERDGLAEASRYCREALAVCPAGWYGADGTRMTILVVLGRIAEAAGDPDTAAARYREVFTVRNGMIGFQVMAEAFDRLAGLAAAGGDPQRAATLLGAVRALGLRADPEGSDIAARVAVSSRQALGPHRYASALAAGSALTPDDAVALSRASPRRPGG